MNRPVGRLREDAAQPCQLVFDKEGHHLGEADGFFLAVGETGNLLALNQGLAVWRLDMTQSSRGMTNQGDRLTGGKEGLDQLDRVSVLDEIPHRAVATWIEDGIEIFLVDAV